MKKTLLTMALTILVGMSASAQPQRSSGENNDNRRAEHAKQRADRLANDLELKGEEKSQFVSLYMEYQQALRPQRSSAIAEGPVEKDRKKGKELSDEEAMKQIDEIFARREEQIAQSQQRLEVDRSYCAKFKEILKPQQLLKLFSRQQGPGQMRQGGQFGGRPGGGYGRQQGGGRPGGFNGPGGGFDGDF